MSDYPYIRAWGRMLHSHDYYVRQQVADARRDDASQDAIYKGQDGRWATFEDITSPDTREQVAALVTLQAAKVAR